MTIWPEHNVNVSTTSKRNVRYGLIEFETLAKPIHEILLIYFKDGKKRITDNALVAITLMIAKSNPVEKETVVTLIVNLINSQN